MRVSFYVLFECVESTVENILLEKGNHDSIVRHSQFSY